MIVPAPLRIRLTEEEDRTLHELSYASGVPQRVKQQDHYQQTGQLRVTVLEMPQCIAAS